MQIKVIRTDFSNNSTIGEVYIDGTMKFYSLEDTCREIPDEPVEEWKIKGKTAIPTGRYKVISDFSNRFQCELPHILNVPGFMGIRIHAGNTSCDTEGCVLIGMGKGQDRINNSRVALNQLMDMIEVAYDREEDIWITIEGLPE